MASRQRGIVSYCWELLRKFYIFIFNDPQSKIIINGKVVNLPLSHQLPIYLNRHPEYDKLIGRISMYLRNESRPLRFIDVGANVGDTIAQFDPKHNDLVIAIEPNEKFGMYLEMNYGNIENIKIINSACSSNVDSLNLAFDEKKGTASLIRADKSTSINVITIDLITNKFYDINYVDIIKIDTDGFDFEVIKGSESTIKKSSPALLFECDVFKNKNYIEDITITLDLFYSCGYKEFLVYDNYGFLIGKYAISDKHTFFQLISYQCLGRAYYFDLLFMKGEQLLEFYKLELSNLPSKINNNFSRIAAERIIEILSSDPK